MLGRLHVLTDAREGRNALAVAEAAVGAGAPVVQVRVKGCSDRALYEFAARVAALCDRHGASCIVNDRVDVALAVTAAGTHLGADDLPVSVARRLVPAGHLIGGTAREPTTARALVAEGADYVGVGPAYATTTKDGLPAALGPAGVRAVCVAVHMPVIAIGGVTAERVPELLAAGAYGVAVVSAISAAADPAAATRQLLAALEKAAA